MKRSTLAEYSGHFSRYAGDAAYVQRQGYRSVRWTYHDVLISASQFARLLEARRVAPGQRVMIWGDNSAEWVAAFWGCVLRGAVVVPMDRIATHDFARRVAEQVEARLALCSRELIGPGLGIPTLTFEEWTQTRTAYSQAPYPLFPARREDTVQIVFTSGTTADPRGVVITHGNILANLEPLEEEIGRYLKYERLFHPIRFLNLLPFSHVFGQFLGLFIPLLMGGSVICLPTLNPGEVMTAIRRERVSVLVAVPRLLESLKDKLERDMEAEGRLEWFRAQCRAALDERFLKRWWRFRRIHRRFGWKFWAVISGGATLDAEAEEFWTRIGYAVIQGYGLTETTSLVSVNHPFRLGKGSIGKTLPGREIKLAEDGEILTRGEGVAGGYWEGSKLRPVIGEDGWFHTGDIGELDAEGNLYFKGRKKNVIVTPQGLNLYPEDLEAALRRQSEVRDCVVIGLPRNGNAEPCAVLLLSARNADPEPVVRRANQSLADFQQIRHWFVWPDEDFPRTSTQKPRTSLIQETVQARLGAGSAKAAEAASSGALAELIARLTGRVPGTLPPDARLETDLNLNSIDRVELLSAIEDRYHVQLSEVGIAEATTVAELEQLLRQPVPERREFVYPRWAQRWPVPWLRFLVYYLLVWPATMILARPDIRGRERFRGLRGPVLIVANHTTRSDIGFVLAALPFRYRHRLAVAMEGERLRDMRNPPRDKNFFVRALERIKYAMVVALFNAFPLPQKSGYRESFAYAGESADRGHSLLVFPEGRLTRDGNIAEFRAGIGLLANNLGLPVVPIRIEGLWELKQRRQRWARPGFVKVTVGEPARFEPSSDPASIARELESRVRSLARLQEGQG